MLIRTFFFVLLSVLPLIASAEDRVFRGIQSIRDVNAYMDVVHVDFGDEEFPSRLMGMIDGMPRLETLVVGGPRYSDHYLKQFARLKSLRVLVLDSVDVSDEAVTELQRSRPKLVVIRSQRIAIDSIQKIRPDIEVATRLNESHPKIRELLGERYFREATRVNFGGIDGDSGPDVIFNEQLAPIKLLRTLTLLDLSWSRLNDGGMCYLKPLANLEDLRLPLDEVSADGLIQLRGMTNLKRFSGTNSRVENGQIDDDGIRHLSGLKNLEFLEINENSKLTDAGLESIGQLTNLQDLTLLSPQIKGTGLRFLVQLPKLTGLGLGSGVRNISHLSEFRSLRRLTLKSASIDDEALSLLDQCLGLEHLSLHGTAIGDAGLTSLQKLPNLRSITVNYGSRVTNSGLATLQRFPKLEYVSLHGMPLNEEGIRNLTAMRNLKSLSVTYSEESFLEPNRRNAANFELRERLKNSLPGCQVD